MDQIPKYQDRKDLLRGKLRNQNKVPLKGKGEFQKSLEGLMLAVVFVDHGKVQDPRIPSAK
ncbi:MAG: Uncharacterised protein [Bacteroidota bacterium]|nr:MAG: Uncharacterised protein [Bacteroidota bacterium]